MLGSLVRGVACFRDHSVTSPFAASPAVSPSACALHSLPIPCSIWRVSRGKCSRLECESYPCNNILYPLLMTLHVQEGLDLAQCKVLAVSQSDQLVKGTEQLECVAQDLPLVQAPAYARDNLSEKVKGVDVLEDVRLAVGDQDHVQLVQWLVDEADVVLLDSRMLRAGVRKFRERRE